MERAALAARLELAGNELGALPPGLGGLRRLQVGSRDLYLGEGSRGGGHVTFFGPAPFPMQVLDVSRNRVRSLRGLPPLPRLEELRLDGNRTRGRGLEPWGAGLGAVGGA